MDFHVWYMDLSESVREDIREHMGLSTDKEVLAATNWDAIPMTTIELP